MTAYAIPTGADAPTTCRQWRRALKQMTPPWVVFHGMHGEGPGHGPGPGHRHGPRGRHLFGPPGFGPGGVGPGPFGPGGRGPGRGPRARRGDVRAAVLLLLAEQPMHGYQIIGELAERSGGAWRPSPGSVYPLLQMLADEGLVRAEDADGRKVFHLTEVGTAEATAAGERRTPWEAAAAGVDDEVATLARQAHAVFTAAAQVAQAGDAAHVTAATRVLDEARRSLYRILAGDEGDPDATAEGAAE